MAAELARKKKVRGGHKASVTKIVAAAEALLAADPPDVTELTSIQMSLEEKLKVLAGLDEGIADLIEDEGELAAEIDKTDDFKRKVYTIMAKIEQTLNPRTTHAAPPPRAASSIATSTTTSKVKLPKLSIAPFNGEPTSWTTFFESFQITIDKNSSLSDVEKFGYLRSLLQGPALEAIAGLALSSANYKQAVEILRKRFGDEQLIIAKHMDALMTMESVPSDRHLRDLRKLYDKAESHVRSLQSLGITADSYGALLSPVLLGKLPPDLRLIVSREMSGSSLKIDKLLKTFEQELSARERANLQSPHPRRVPDRKTPPTTSALLTSHREGNNELPCPYCQQPHSASSCTSLTDVTARKNVLKTSGRCYNCLRKRHVTRNCRSASRCRNCKGKHHTSICDVTEQNKPTSLADTASYGLRPEAPPFQTRSKDSKTTTVTVCSNRSQVVFLQTARAVIKNPKRPKSEVEVRLLLDGGSQRSYISERAQQLLQLHAIDEHSLSIATFGSTGADKKVCPIVEVNVSKGLSHAANVSVCCNIYM